MFHFYWYLAQSDFFGATRTSKSAIVDALVSDLKGIATDLPWLPTAQGRVSRGVALGTAARIAMVDRRYQEVVSITDNIINNGSLRVKSFLPKLV
jgi:hypothetical protein